MRTVRFTLIVSAVVGLGALLALNWRAQLQTHHKLDALAAALADRPAASPSQPTPAPGEVPRELSHVVIPPSPYVIETPDVLQIEAAVRDAETGAVRGLPHQQQVSGSFLVRPDGTVGLGVWGSVCVTGLTPGQASEAIRKHLAEAAPGVPGENLKVVVDLLAYNSKAYYVILDAPDGEQVVRLPVTGSETVLDAVAAVPGLAQVAATKSIRVARQSAGGPYQVLPVDWAGITRHGVTTTNYQLRAGDRVYVTRAGG